MLIGYIATRLGDKIRTLEKSKRRIIHGKTVV